jgi:3-oxoacyl-[acyl-carrier-protein] synthase-1
VKVRKTGVMIRKIADNIYSPLGCTTEENYVAGKQGRSMLQSYPAGTMDLQEPFTASLFDWDAMELIPGYTRFETIVIRSMSRALEQTSVDVHSERLLFVLSSTKGNVELLDSRALQHTDERIGLDAAARAVADYFGFRRTPLVVSNACISGFINAFARSSGSTPSGTLICLSLSSSFTIGFRFFFL